MINRKHLIIAAAIIIIIAFAIFSFTKEDVTLNVYAQEIENTSDIYLVSEIHKSNGEIADTQFGKMTIELLDKDGNGVGYNEVPIDHGVNTLRHYGKPVNVNVHYDGGYVYNPCDYSAKLQYKDTPVLTDDNLTSS